MDYSYIAGFFDGEGNINFIKQKKGIFIQLRMYQIEPSEEVLLEIQKFLGYGKIYRRIRKVSCNTISELTITDKKSIKDFLNNILPYSIVKVKNIKYILDNYNFEHKNNLGFDFKKIEKLNFH